MGSLLALCFSLLPAWLLGSRLLSPVFGAGLGVICGILFGVSIAAFAGRREEEFALKNPCAPREKLLDRGAANHFLRGGAVGGHLWLTDERLYFESHAYNLQNHTLTIPLSGIEGARLGLISAFVPTGLEVVTDGKRERLAIQNRRDWAGAIREATDHRTSPVGG